MGIPRTEIVDFEEYKVLINYDGKGGIEVSILDELGDEIEGLYVSDSEDVDEFNDDDFDINLN